MSRRVSLIVAGIVTAATTAAVFATPAVYAGITFNALD
jgi:hypothetical protein